MAKITWKGEDELHNGAGPSFAIAYDGIKFPKGVPVEVTDKAFIKKAQGNQYFEVEDDEDIPEKRRGRPPKVDHVEDPS